MMSEQPEQLRIEGLDELGWKPSSEVQFETWEAIGDSLRRRRGRQENGLSSTLWGLGDWLNYGDAVYGEKHAQALDAVDYSSGNMSKIAKVSQEFPRDRRRSTVSFWKFAEMLGLSWDSQRMLLDRIEEEGMTTAEVRREVALLKKVERAEQTELDIDEEDDEHLADCPLCGARNSISRDRAVAYESEMSELARR